MMYRTRSSGVTLATILWRLMPSFQALPPPVVGGTLVYWMVLAMTGRTLALQMVTFLLPASRSMLEGAFASQKLFVRGGYVLWHCLPAIYSFRLQGFVFVAQTIKLQCFAFELYTPLR